MSPSVGLNGPRGTDRPPARRREPDLDVQTGRAPLDCGVQADDLVQGPAARANARAGPDPFSRRAPGSDRQRRQRRGASAEPIPEEDRVLVRAPVGARGSVGRRKDAKIGYRQHAIHLTKREFQLFARLADRSPAYTSAEQLLSDAWRDPGLPQETVRTYIVRLRRKLAELDAPVQIANRSRRGYSLVFDDRPSMNTYDSAT